MNSLINKTFGRWSVIGPHEIRRVKKRNRHFYRCRCICGNVKFVRRSNLLNGSSRSCGCLRRDMMRDKQTIHGLCQSREYHSWRNMIQRCRDENATSYERYGKRGISVCARWMESFQNFLEDMGMMPDITYSIERIDNDGDYAPNNCRWATTTEQARNTRRNRILEHKGMALPVAEWVEITGIKSTTIRQRIDGLGWSVHDALTKPVQKRQSRP